MNPKINGLPTVQVAKPPAVFDPGEDYRGGRDDSVGLPVQKYGASKGPSPPPRIIRVRDVMGRTGLARTTIWTYCAAGTFPQPIKLGPNATGWLESEVDAWIVARISERGAA